LRRCPKGRKGYQGRVERTHGIDDEEFYLPYLKEIEDEEEFLNSAGQWIYWYNTGRPHLGEKMNGKTPYEKLKESGYNLPIEFCAFPQIILDKISSHQLLNFSKRGGNDLCAYDKILLNSHNKHLSLFTPLALKALFNTHHRLKTIKFLNRLGFTLSNDIILSPF